MTQTPPTEQQLEQAFALQERHGKNLSPAELLKAEADLVKRQSGVRDAPVAMTRDIPSGALTTVITPHACPLHSIVVTAAGTDAARVYDHAARGEGRSVQYIPANTPAGTVYTFDGPASQMQNGLVVVNTANGPALTVSYN